MTPKTYGARLRAEIRRRGMTQDEFAKLSRIDRSKLNGILNDRETTSWGAGTAAKIAETLRDDSFRIEPRRTRQTMMEQLVNGLEELRGEVRDIQERVAALESRRPARGSQRER